MDDVSEVAFEAVLKFWYAIAQFLKFLWRHPFTLIVIILVIGFLLFLVIRFTIKVLKRCHEMANKVIDRHYEVANKKVDASIKIAKADNELNVINAENNKDEKTL
ncbi:MAG: hypothetical protein LBM02_06450 [Lachnospiraceae bacterium]|jgi:sensor histidine kinase YesM|nr:hypothetical protein [Lachnospiraceae bacterium]